MDIYYVIKEPLITEKVTQTKGESNRYYFRVDPSATKVDIKRAVETIFKVDVDCVRTITVHSKPHRNPRSRQMLRRADWKKAIVTLKKGGKIALFEGV